MQHPVMLLSLKDVLNTSGLCRVLVGQQWMELWLWGNEIAVTFFCAAGGRGPVRLFFPGS